MGRKKKIKDEGKNPSDLIGLKDETKNWVSAVVFFALSIFFILASLGKAGLIGNKIYGSSGILSALFGYGYFLIPSLFIILSISSAMSIKRSLTKARFFGAFLFLVSSLALLDLSFKGKGGLLGSILQKPLLRLFDVYATAVILSTLVIVSIIIIFDASISFERILSIFRKKDLEEEEEDVKILENGQVASMGQIKEKVPIQGPVLSKNIVDGGEKSEMGEFKISLKNFTPPPLSLLERDRGKPEVGDIKANANIIKRTLQNFGIIVEMDEISIGPSVTRYALKPAEGVKLSKILGLQNNLELALAAHPVRIEAPIPGKSLVGIEIPNMIKTTVGLASIFSQEEYKNSDKALTVALGKNISGTPIFANISKMPHLLIAGATGSGKSVTIHVMINSLLFRNSPENLKFIMIDPKRVELTLYNKIPHLLTPVITDPKKVIMSLKWAAKEMDRRYDILEKNKVRDIESYHKNIFAPYVEKLKKEKSVPEETIDSMPYIVIVIDELADIMQAYPRELEAAIIRLAQMSRAVGIHLILSTQRPSVNVITGLIKANIPTRIALQVASQFDSRTILDTAGAEKLLGAGDMLYLSGEMSKPVRIQSPYISENEVKKVANYLAENWEHEAPTEINMEADQTKNVVFDAMNDDGASEDDMYEEAREIVIRAGKASTSYLQRKLRIGYARAARLMDILEENSVIGPGEGAKPREVLIKPEGGFITDKDEEEENELQ